MDKCININNSRVQEISKALNVPPALAASKIEVWMDNNNGKIPKVEDIIGNRYYNINRHIWIYDQYNLLNEKGRIKQFPNKKQATDFAKSLNRSPNFDFHIREYNGNYRILVFNPFENAEDDMFSSPEQLKLFNQEPNRGTKDNNKFKDFLGGLKSDSQTALKKIAESDNWMSDVAKKLLATNLNIPIEIVDVDYFTKDNLPEGVTNEEMEDDFKGAGFYNKGKIYIARGTSADTQGILMHESLHGYTSKYVRENYNSGGVQNLVRLLNHLQSPEISKLINKKYAISDLDELITHIFTSPEFIEDLKLIPPTNRNFISVWDEIKQILKVIFKMTNRSIFDEVFAASANVVQNSIDKYNEAKEDSNLFEEAIPRFSEEGANVQKLISNKLDELGRKAKNIDGNYVVEGYDINWKRPSSIAKAIIGGFTAGIKTEVQSEREKLYQEAGTILHAIQANIVKKAFPEFNQAVEDYQAPVELLEMQEVLEEQLKPIIAAAKSRGSVLKAEVFLGNTKSQKAGTADLLEITPDGKYYTYDLKTRYTSDKGGVARFNKVKEWSLQTNEYNKMLVAGDSELGVVKGEVLGTYVLEFIIEPKKNDIKFSGNVTFTGTRPEKFLKNRQFKSFTIVAPTFLRTNDEKIDELIEKLLKQTEELKKFRGGSEIQREAKNQLLLSKLQLLQDLQLRKDLNKVLDAASFELSYIQELIESGNIQEEQQFIKEQLELYSDILDYFEDVPKELEDKVVRTQGLAQKLYKKYLKLGEQNIKEAAKTTGISNFADNVFTAVKDINWFRKMTTGVSNVDNPVIATAYRTVTTALAKSRDKIQVMANNLKTAQNKLVNYLGKADYSMMIDGDKFVQEFTTDFWKAQYQAKNNNDSEWFEDNVTYNKEKYEEAREKQLNYQESFGKKSYINYLKLENPQLTPEELDFQADKMVAERMKEWDAANNKNRTKYFTPNKEWRNPKWVEIKEGKYKGTPVEQFYDLYSKYLEVANEIAPDKKFNKGFIANFSKTFIEKSANEGLLGAIKGSWSGMLDNISSDYDDTYGQKDINTGEIVRSLYIPGMSDTKKDKSLDLASSMYKFMEGVYRYQELKEIEGTIIATKEYLKSAKFLEVNRFGKVVENVTSGGTKIENSNTYQMFSNWADGILYGQYKKGETAVKIKGNGFTQLFGLKKGEEKAISVTKVIDGFIKYTGIRNLGFNIYSPFTNLFGGASNQYMTGASGVYYSGTDLNKAYSLVLGGKTNFPNEEVKKIRAILNWLQIDTNEFNRDRANELSAFKGNKLLDKYNAMTLMQESENIMREAGAIAMILSGKNGVTMADFELDGDSVKTNLDIYKRESLRQKIVRVNSLNIGGINSDDIMMAKTYIAGRLLMQHRSWLPAMFYNRFGQKQFDYILEKDIEGRYVTVYKAFKLLFNKSKFSELEEFEKTNLKEAAAELALIISVGILTALIKGGLDDDDKEEAYYKISQKISNRFMSELTFFVDPTFQSQYQILIKPAAAAGTAEDFGRFIGSLYKEGFGTEKEKKANNPTKKAIKLVPGANKVESFLDDLGVFKEE